METASFACWSPTSRIVASKLTKQNVFITCYSQSLISTHPQLWLSTHDIVFFGKFGHDASKTWECSNPCLLLPHPNSTNFNTSSWILWVPLSYPQKMRIWVSASETLAYPAGLAWWWPTALHSSAFVCCCWAWPGLGSRWSGRSESQNEPWMGFGWKLAAAEM